MKTTKYSNLNTMSYPELNTVHHRPWPKPNWQWIYYQEWNNSVFLHYKVPKILLETLVPKELEIDAFEGDTWISFVAFNMENTRPAYLPSFRPISNFHELNIRTYVRYQGKPGVYFLSIEAGNKISAFLAEKLSGLPYRYSLMNRKDNEFYSENIAAGEYFNIEYSIKEEVNSKSSLEIFLTEKYALFQDVNSKIESYDVHHVEWPIYSINLNKAQIQYPKFKNIEFLVPDLKHYSTGVKVWIWKSK